MAEGFTIWELGPVLFCGKRREMLCLLKCRMEKAGGEIFPFARCHLKAPIQGQQAHREESGLRPWDGKRQHPPTCPNTSSSSRTCSPQLRGKGEAGKSSGGTKVGHGESRCFCHVWAYVISRPLTYTKQPHFEHGPRQTLSTFMEERTGRAGLGQKWSASACGREFSQLKEMAS